MAYLAQAQLYPRAFMGIELTNWADMAVGHLWAGQTQCCFHANLKPVASYN